MDDHAKSPSALILSRQMSISTNSQIFFVLLVIYFFLSLNSSHNSDHNYVLSLDLSVNVAAVLTCNSSVTERMDNQLNANYNKCVLSLLAYIYVISVVVLHLRHMDEGADIKPPLFTLILCIF